MEDKIVIIKNDTDLTKVSALILKEEKIILDTSVLEKFKKQFQQFAFNIHTGDIVAAIINNELEVQGNVLKV